MDQEVLRVIKVTFWPRWPLPSTAVWYFCWAYPTLVFVLAWFLTNLERLLAFLASNFSIKTWLWLTTVFSRLTVNISDQCELKFRWRLCYWDITFWMWYKPVTLRPRAVSLGVHSTHYLSVKTKLISIFHYISWLLL